MKPIPQQEDAEIYKGEYHGLRTEILQLMPFEICVNGQPVGLFHYGQQSNTTGGITPLGYCAEGCPGHTTKQEAREHYRQWMLDEELIMFSGEESGPCAICGQQTDGGGDIIHDGVHDTLSWTFKLCPAHRSRVLVERLFNLNDPVFVKWLPHDPELDEEEV